MAKKLVILMDQYDNQANWREILFKEVWKDIYIPKNLRGKIKITFDKKEQRVVIKNKKHDSSKNK